MEFPVFMQNNAADKNACIKCGACLAACPANLSPLRLFALWLDSETGRMQREESLHRCILCRKCDAVCPSVLPLANSFAAAQAVSEKQGAKRANAERLRARHQNHMRRAAAPPQIATLNPAALAAQAQKRAAAKERKNAAA